MASRERAFDLSKTESETGCAGSSLPTWVVRETSRGHDLGGHEVFVSLWLVGSSADIKIRYAETSVLDRLFRECWDG